MAASATSMSGIISRNPRESVALLVGAGAISIIFVNALFMQKGPHPAPIFAPKSAMVRGVPAPVINHPMAAAVPAPPPRPEAAPRKGAHTDPIAQLLAPTNRVLAVQRVLTDYGYGQIRPTGLAGPDTEEAIRKFERSKKLPVTGVLSDQLIKALSDMSGQRID